MSVPSGVMVIQSLHVAKILIQSLNEKEISEITSDESQGTVYSVLVLLKYKKVAYILLSLF